jgi:hypothetical protein
LLSVDPSVAATRSDLKYCFLKADIVDPYSSLPGP